MPNYYIRNAIVEVCVQIAPLIICIALIVISLIFYKYQLIR
nr:MAG TPA: hypothetical protein [Caudoviricetes sp.]